MSGGARWRVVEVCDDIWHSSGTYLARIWHDGRIGSVEDDSGGRAHPF